MILNFKKNTTGINGEIKLPASKSISNRVLIIRAVCNTYFEINNISNSNDSIVLQNMILSENNILNAEDAGTAMRFMTALAASTFGEWFITGTERMKQRPIGPLADALKKLGAIIEYTDLYGCPPLKIKGTKLQGCDIEIPGNVSSQFISALLMIAPSVMGGLRIKIQKPITSKPYIEMTLELMEFFGVHHSWDKNTIIISEQEYKPRDFTVESDWSAASYWYEIVALSEKAEITLTGLKKNSIQGDSILAEIFEELGVKTTSVKDGIKLSKINITATNFDMDCSDYPDLIPALAVTLSLLNIPYFLTGLESLKIKESDRIIALQHELSKVGYAVFATDNSLKWDGNCSEINDQIIFETYKDHRLAMALAPVSMKLPNVQIQNPEVVNKSYPYFWSDLQLVGFVIQ